MRSLVWPLKKIPPTLSTNFRWLVISLVSFLLLWGTVSLLLNEPTLLPTPWEVFIGFFNLIKDGQLLTDIQASLQRVFIGFFIATCLAVPLGIILAYFYIPRQILLPIITILRPIPPIAWIPLAILWFGIGDSSSYFITALAAFFPIFINSFAGGKAVEHQHINAAKCLGARRFSLVTTIFLPSAMPQVWAGLRIGLGQSWMAVVTSELIAAQSGLGYMIQANRLNLETSYVLVGMVVIGILGALMNAALGYIEQYVIPWKPQYLHG
ncbi:ABC transporter permease [Nostoc flagelliforme FACHB-838]|uniref:ABC transporter permease n=1 Tax=Nostoc flagelliforme FACHB-838 TaxID=2692904 RepID=A0ABR8E4X0_9NOSO|nr:ABC transporter permease [Nostoc flagelliforme]MBD2536448.1 ABC transporter permease [Nostoc flagelliforme FACHB-838]